MEKISENGQSFFVMVFKGNKKVGDTWFSEEEATHFENTPNCKAGVALSPNEMEAMGLVPDDDILLVINRDLDRETHDTMQEITQFIRENGLNAFKKLREDAKFRTDKNPEGWN